MKALNRIQTNRNQTAAAATHQEKKSVSKRARACRLCVMLLASLVVITFIMHLGQSLLLSN